MPAPVAPGQVSGFMKFILFVGWIGMLLGIAFAVIAANSRYGHDLELPAAILCCLGFGFVTYPFVVRELQNGGRRSVREPTS